MSGPVALARLAASDRPDCSSEGAWALHVLSTKGGDKIAAKMARTPEVMAILEKRAFERETEDDDVALANKVAQITLEMERSCCTRALTTRVRPVPYGEQN